MNQTHKHIIAALISLATLATASAQDVVTIEEDSGKTEIIDMPEGMLISEEELMNEPANKTGLRDGEGQARTLSYNDSLILSRLQRIPTTIDMPLNDITRKFIDTYSNKMKGSVATMLGSSNFYMPIFEEALERYNLPLELRYLPVIESALRPSATSRAGAAGLWQFMSATAKRYGLEINTLVDERRDPIKSSEAAAHYLSDLYAKFGDWGLAIAAYNCGEGNVQKALLRTHSQEDKDYWTVYNNLPRETRGYVPAFIAANYIMTYYCEHGIVPKTTSLPEESDTVVVAGDLKLSTVAAACNVTVDELRTLNPQYRRDIVPMNYSLRLPSHAIEAFILQEDSLYGNKAMATARPIETADSEAEEEETVSTRTTTSRSTRNSRRKSRQRTKSVSVRSGDSLSTIARRNGTTVTKLRKLNGIRGNMIHPGQKIRVK